MNFQKLTSVTGGILAGGILLAVAVSGLFGQEAASQKDEEFNLRVPVSEVVVPVSVEDDKGRPVTGLQKSDFLLHEDGFLQTITRFSIDPMPLSIAVLIDSSTDQATQNMIKENIVPFVESMSSFDEASVFEFEHVADQVQNFTSNKEDLIKAFNKLALGAKSPTFDGLATGPFSSKPTVNGIPVETATGTVQPSKTINTHIDDAIFAAAQALRLRDKGRRKIILIITDGQNAPGNRHNYGRTMELVSSSDIIVYAISQGASLISRRVGNRAARYARETGGEVFYPVKSGSFSEDYQKIAQMARNQYVLGYASSQSVDGITYHEIEVSIAKSNGKSYKIRNRKGYYAVPAY